MQPNAIWEASHNFNYSELQLAGGFLFFQEAKADRLGVAVCDKRFLKINREIEIFRILLHFAEPTKWLAFKMPHTYGHTISPPHLQLCALNWAFGHAPKMQSSSLSPLHWFSYKLQIELKQFLAYWATMVKLFCKKSILFKLLSI